MQLLKSLFDSPDDSGPNKIPTFKFLLIFLKFLKDKYFLFLFLKRAVVPTTTCRSCTASDMLLNNFALPSISIAPTDVAFALKFAATKLTRVFNEYSKLDITNNKDSENLLVKQSTSDGVSEKKTDNKPNNEDKSGIKPETEKI